LRELNLVPPGDARIAFDFDLKITREAVAYELGSDELAKRLIPEGEVVLLNKIPGYPDQADEVIVRGRVVGHRFYDVLERAWRFRPLNESVREMVENKVGYYAVVDLPKLARGYVVHRGRVVEGVLPERKFRHVAVATKDYRWYGVAKALRGRRLQVIKSWTNLDPMPKGRTSSLEDFVKLNEDVVVSKSEKAMRFLSRVVSRIGKPVVVSYSGGKDSLVVLDLTSKIGVDYHVLFNDTGLELPETLENVRVVVERYNAKLLVASAERRFWEAIDIFGPPARDYRWCCKLIKLAPISSLVKRVFPEEALVVVGQRSYESLSRARIPAVSRSKWVVNVVMVAPINEWSALDVWAYIFLNKLPYNRAYEMGFDRLGCSICPANELAELELVARWYPEIWVKFVEGLSLHKCDERCVKYGTWRWVRPPGDFQRFVKAKPMERGEFVRLEPSDGLWKVRVARGVDWRLLGELLKTVGDVHEANDHYLVRVGSNFARIFRDLTVEADDQSLRRVIPQIVRSASCTRCMLCANWCPRGALEVRGGRLFVSSRCNRCGFCLTVCPAVQYLLPPLDKSQRSEQ